MDTVRNVPLQHRHALMGQAVIAWGYGRMRPGHIVSVGPKNARVRLVAGANGREYRKAIPHGEVYIVADTDDAGQIATRINRAARRKVGRNYGVDVQLAHEFADLFGTTTTYGGGQS